MKIVFYIFISLMLLGNCFALYQLIVSREAFLSKFPALTDKTFMVMQFLPVVNIVAMIGLLFFKSWATWLAIIGAVAVIAADVYFNINYHLYVAVPSALLLLFFIVRYWNEFK